MRSIGLTGGIGAGKSTVARLLAERGAQLIDADLVAREIVEPGTHALSRIVEHFGEKVLRADGSLDRAALAAIVFGDSRALGILNEITHPEILSHVRSRLSEMRSSLPEAPLVVLDMAILDRSVAVLLGLDVIVVVDCPIEVAIRRLVSERGFSEKDARLRVASQPPREQRLALADFVVDNSGDRRHLEAQVEDLWGWLEVAE